MVIGYIDSHVQGVEGDALAAKSIQCTPWWVCYESAVQSCILDDIYVFQFVPKVITGG
jgi:hypothetical protein